LASGGGGAGGGVEGIDLECVVSRGRDGGVYKGVIGAEGGDDAGDGVAGGYDFALAGFNFDDAG
jgi:hypothetical protein